MPEAPPTPPDPSANHKGWMSLLGGNKFLILLVVISGGGNIWQTQQSEQVASHDVDRAIAEVHTLYSAVGEALDRSKRVEGKLDELLKRSHPQ